MTERKQMKTLITFALSITMIFVVLVIGACNTDITLSHRVDDLVQHVQDTKNGGNLSFDYIDELLENLSELRVEAKHLEGENGVLITRIDDYITQLEILRNELKAMEGFVLVISMYNTTVVQGQDFIVNVELRNQSGEGREVGWNFGFFPHIPGYIDYICPDFHYPYNLQLDLPILQSRFLENNEVLRNLSIFGEEMTEGVLISTSGLRFGTLELSRGTHELRFHFGIINIIWSNTITLKVK